jgi:hypothetical protein
MVPRASGYWADWDATPGMYPDCKHCPSEVA